MRNQLNHVKPALLVLVMLIFNILLLYYIRYSMGLTDGRYIYPLDDTYIHLTIGKNVAEYGCWGVLPYEFNSATSSPIYTVVLAVMIRLFGDSENLPIYFNIFIGNLMFLLIFSYFRESKLRFLLMSLLLITPVLLHVIIMTGMEHTLHMVLMLATLMAFDKVINRSTESSGSESNYLFLFLTSLLCMARYESMFFIGGMTLILIIHARYRLAMLTMICGILPVVLFGLNSLSHGGFFFPNSVLLKGNVNLVGGFEEAMIRYFKRLINVPLILTIVLIIYKFFSTQGIRSREYLAFIKQNSLLFLMLVTVGMHSLFASFGWMYRYEAYIYLLVCFLFVRENYQLAPVAKEQLYARKTSRVILISVIIFACIHGIYRYYESQHKARFAGKNIYEQQVQTSLFLNRYYKGSTVLANDIGAVSYFSGIYLVDPVGLGSIKILKMKHAAGGDFVPFKEMVNVYPNHSPIIYVIYDMWYERQAKEAGLIKAGETQIVGNVICAADKVSFYAGTEMEAEKLAENLREFKASMPQDVILKVK